MPRKPVDYSKTVIYKIVCIDTEVDYIYIGSTTDFTRRKQHHKNCCNDPKDHAHNNKKYIEIRNNGGWQNFKMLEIKKFPCNDKREAELEEDKVMIELKANMNTCRAYRPKKQWYVDNKEHVSKKNKQYYKDNKEKINEKHNCECGGKYTNSGKSHHFKTKKHQNYLEQK